MLYEWFFVMNFYIIYGRILSQSIRTLTSLTKNNTYIIMWYNILHIVSRYIEHKSIIDTYVKSSSVVY